MSDCHYNPSQYFYIIFDFSDTGETLENIADVIRRDYRKLQRSERPWVTVFNKTNEFLPSLNFLINAENNYRCTEKYTIDEDEDGAINDKADGLAQDSYSFCNLIIKYFFTQLRVDNENENESKCNSRV